MRRAILSIAALATGVVPSAADPLTRLLPRDAAAPLCFQRLYDEAHLHHHPRQAVRAVLLSLRRGPNETEVFARVRFTTKEPTAPLLAGALCSWDDSGVNRGQYTDQPLVPNFPKESGLGCAWTDDGLAMGDEAAQFPIDLDPSGHTLTLYTRDGVTAWAGGSGDHARLALGSDDRIFRLDRVDAALCADIDRAIAYPHRE